MLYSDSLREMMQKCRERPGEKTIQTCRDPEHPIPIILFGTGFFSGIGKIIEICAWLNLEVLSVPEGLVHSIGILVAPGVFLVRRWPKS